MFDPGQVPIQFFYKHPAQHRKGTWRVIAPSNDITVYPAVVSTTPGFVQVTIRIAGTIPAGNRIMLHLYDPVNQETFLNADFDPTDPSTDNGGITEWAKTIDTGAISGTRSVGTMVFSNSPPYAALTNVVAGPGVFAEGSRLKVGTFDVNPVVTPSTVSWLEPFAANSYWKTPLPAGTTYADPATDLRTQVTRALPNKVFCNQGRFIGWLYKATDSDPFVTINVSAEHIGATPTRAGNVTLRLPTNAHPDPGYNGGTQPVGEEWRLQAGVQNDKHMVIISPDGSYADEFWYAHNTNPTNLSAGQYRAVAWVRVPLLTGDGLNIQGYNSQNAGKGWDNSDWAGSTLGWSCTKAYGGTGMGGIIRAGDLTGSLTTMPEHVMTAALPDNILRHSSSQQQNGFGFIFPPASRPDFAGGTGANQKIPHGMRFALPPSFNIDALTTTAGKKFAYAAKKYGIMIVDVANGGGFACNGDYNYAKADIDAFQAAASDRTVIGNNLVWARVPGEAYIF